MSPHNPFRVAATALLPCVLAASCGGSLVHKKPANEAQNAATTALWAKEIRRVARDGDWILTRSYSVTGDLIVGLSPGESLSHASIYDAERGTVIEAIAPEVREITLEALLSRNRYAVVLRPTGQDAAKGKRALDRARGLLGTDFDHLGVFGINRASKFYCSELVAWASRVPTSGLVVTPAALFEKGEMIYFSGARDEYPFRVASSEH